MAASIPAFPRKENEQSHLQALGILYVKANRLLALDAVRPPPENSDAIGILVEHHHVIHASAVAQTHLNCAGGQYIAFKGRCNKVHAQP